MEQYDGPVMLAAFEGWNDAADAATAVVRHLIDTYDAELIDQFDDETYYDYQVTRPIVGRGFDDPLDLDWPTTRVYTCRPSGWEHDLICVLGAEPSLRWRSFCDELLSLASSLGVSMISTLGAMLTDTPHSRPVPITGLATPQDLAVQINLQPAEYTGPAGINAALANFGRQRRFDTLTLWAGVPHYLAEPPCPKATLALLTRLEDALGVTFNHGDLHEQVEAWQRGAELVMADDPTLAEYVEELELSVDEGAVPGTTAEDIARDFERFLRRRDTGE